VVIEVNSSPGLEGIELATGVDVAKSIIDYLDKIALNRSTKDSAQF
jgi:ribosomal protein S6--L-glutamate ligase